MLGFHRFTDSLSLFRVDSVSVTTDLWLLVNDNIKLAQSVMLKMNFTFFPNNMSNVLLEIGCRKIG